MAQGSKAAPHPAKMLLREAQTLGSISHPNIVACYGGCIAGNACFIVEVRAVMAALLVCVMELDGRARGHAFH